MRRRTALLIIVLLVFALFAISCSSEEVEHKDPDSEAEAEEALSEPEPVLQEGTQEGNIAPDVELISLDGEVHNLSDFKGKVVLLNFGTTWCPYCHQEKPVFQSLYERYEDQGFIVLSVYIGEDEATVREAVEETYDYTTYPAFLDENRAAFRVFDRVNGSVPQTYVIDREGIVRAYRAGQWTIINNSDVVDVILEEEDE